MRKLVVLLRGAIVKSSVDLGISAQLSHTLFGKQSAISRQLTWSSVWLGICMAKNYH